VALLGPERLDGPLMPPLELLVPTPVES